MAKRIRTARHPAPEDFPAEEASQEEPEAPQEAASNGSPMSKADAVRAAMAEGIEKPQEGIDFIKARFGIVMEKPKAKAPPALAPPPRSPASRRILHRT